MVGKRPELGTLKAGDEVFVVRRGYEMRGREPGDRYIPATVAKVGRVWIDIEVSIERRTHKMRLDTQREQSNYSAGVRSFVTPEQKAWDERLNDARRFLGKKHRIRADIDSPWYGREIELADLIRAGIEESHDQAWDEHTDRAVAAIEKWQG